MRNTRNQSSFIEKKHPVSNDKKNWYSLSQKDRQTALEIGKSVYNDFTGRRGRISKEEWYELYCKTAKQLDKKNIHIQRGQLRQRLFTEFGILEDSE